MSGKQFSNFVTLKVNGREYQNWLDVSIQCTLQSLARVFSVRATRSKEDLTIGIQPGDEVQVLIGDDLVLTGYVTKKEISYSASNISVTVSGASKTVDLQECCMPHGAPNSFKNQTHKQNLQAVCSLFGIEVKDQVQSSDRRNFEFAPAEIVGMAITRYLQKNGILLTDDEAGNLVIAKAGSEGNANDILELGSNILEGKRTQDVSKRFSHYVTLGQAANPSSELPVSANRLKAIAKDENVKRSRWFVKQESGNASAEILQRKAQVIKFVNIGDSDTFSYKLQGWRQSNGDLWKVNSKVFVVDPLLEEDGRFGKVIQSITYSLTGAGTSVVLDLCDEAKYETVTEADSKNITIDNYEDIKKDSGKT